MNKVKLSNYQLAVIAIGFFHGSTTIANPAIAAKRDAWIAVILGTLISTLLVTLYLYLSKFNIGRNLVEITEYCFGNTFSKIVCIIYIIYFLYISAFNTRTFGEFMVTVSYPETPLIVLLALLTICAVYAARSGLTVTGKTCEVLVPLLPIAILIVTLSLLGSYDFTGFKPMFLEITPIIQSSLDIASSIYGDFIIFLMILPYTNSAKGRFKATYIAVIITSLMTLIISSRNILILGPVLSEYFRYPSHVAAQLIPAISIDPLVDMNLFIGGGIKVTICLYAVSKMTAELLRIKKYKPFVSAYGLLSIVLSIWFFPNAMELYRWLKSNGDGYVSIPVQLLFPLTMLIITLIKNKRNKGSIKKSPRLN